MWDGLPHSSTPKPSEWPVWAKLLARGREMSRPDNFRWGSTIARGKSPISPVRRLCPIHQKCCGLEREGEWERGGEGWERRGEELRRRKGEESLSRSTAGELYWQTKTLQTTHPCPRVLKWSYSNKEQKPDGEFFDLIQYPTGSDLLTNGHHSSSLSRTVLPSHFFTEPIQPRSEFVPWLKREIRRDVFTDHK